MRLCLLSTCFKFCSSSLMIVHLLSTVSLRDSAKATALLAVLRSFLLGEGGTLSSFSSCSRITSFSERQSMMQGQRFPTQRILQKGGAALFNRFSALLFGNCINTAAAGAHVLTPKHVCTTARSTTASTRRCTHTDARER